jgi:oligopeptide/dipeptide ABC transporter ATP-binding protein
VTSVLCLQGIGKSFRRGGRVTRALDGVDLSVGARETVGLIGESGSGKSTLARIALMLVPPTNGSIEFEGEDLRALSARQLRARRARMQIVFQEPGEALDPQPTVCWSVAEPLVVQRPRVASDEIRDRVRDALTMVRLDPALADRYPSQLSGGQQQRVGIARAIISRPSLVVLDEPTSSLDLSVRAGIIALLQRLQQELGLAYLFISHDLGTVEYLADRLVVLYRGRIMETGPTADVIAEPQHPYTRALVDARLDVDPRVRATPARVVGTAGGGAADTGCAYALRCPWVQDDCRVAPVPLNAGSTNREAACLHPLTAQAPTA